MTNVDTEIHQFKFIFRELEKNKFDFWSKISSKMDQIFVKNRKFCKKIENFVKKSKILSKIGNLN